MEAEEASVRGVGEMRTRFEKPGPGSRLSGLQSLDHSQATRVPFCLEMWNVPFFHLT